MSLPRLRLLPALLLCASLAAAAEPSLPGDPLRGRDLLSEKRCTQCHSVWSHGGSLGPDISTAVAGKSLLDLVGDFWNHTPRMIDAMIGRGYLWPTLNRREMGDLLSYLYYLRLFDEPGDATRGEIAYSHLRCVTCHSLAGQGGALGGPLDRFSEYPSAMELGQAMWNAGPKMQRAQIGRLKAISIFSGGEMSDIQAYIRSRGKPADRRVRLLPLPDPARGAAIFRAKRCNACHRPGSGGAPDLRAAALNLTVAEISGTLWNHSYTMSEWMRARAIPFPRFSGTEMADLIAYLYFMGFVSEEGDANRGALMFRERGCARCHEGPKAPVSNLAESDAVKDPIAMSSAMWNHAPEMHKLMAAEAVAWPQFDPGDMEDLVAHLRRAASAQQHRQP
jgi:cytochrome c2